MAETTSHETEWTRAETATFLRALADGLEAEGDLRVTIGNKNVELSPPDSIEMAAAVTERSRRFRKDVEELDLQFKWYPAQATTEAATDGGR
jgi:amphi-Trp domain-containing protein